MLHGQRSVAQPACLRLQQRAPCPPLFVCAAAAEAAAEGTLEPLVELVLSDSDPRGGLSWPKDLPLLLSHVVGALGREVELDAPLRVSRGEGGAVVLTEIKLSAAGEVEAARNASPTAYH